MLSTITPVLPPLSLIEPPTQANADGNKENSGSDAPAREDEGSSDEEDDAAEQGVGSGTTWVSVVQGTPA